MLRPITREEYHQVTAGEKTERIQGVIFNKMSKSPLHTKTLLFLYECISPILSKKYALQKEDPIALGDSEPEPDLAIVDRPRSVNEDHPRSAHLVVEVSLTTKVFDSIKAAVYAVGNIPTYWNILPDEKKTVVYKNPQAGAYTAKHEIAFSEKLVAVLPEQTIEICLADVLGIK